MVDMLSQRQPDTALLYRATDRAEGLQSMDSRDASAVEVIWTWLAHEHRFKRTLDGAAEALVLDAITMPPELDIDRLRMVMSAVAIACEKYRAAVLQTIEDWRTRSWTARRMKSGDLGRVFAQLPSGKGLQAGGDYVPERVGPSQQLLSGWLEYLRNCAGNAQLQHEEEGHAAIIEELKAGSDVGWIIVKRRGGSAPGDCIIADGRHRLFAVLDLARVHPVLEQPVFQEK
jgi:hypothetical protein